MPPGFQRDGINFEWLLSGRRVWHAGVRFRLSIGGLLFAWLCASGGLLDIAQVFAWSRMCAGYAQTMPVREALTETFDPAKPCEICMAVLKVRKADEAKRSPASAPETWSLAKVVLIAAEAEAVVSAPVLEAWPVSVNCYAEARSYPVPVPPPRGGAGFVIG